MSDFDNYGLIGAQTNAYPVEKMCRQPNLKERLDLAVQAAEQKLAAVKEAREIFQRNPDIERLLDIMQKGSF